MLLKENVAREVTRKIKAVPLLGFYPWSLHLPICDSNCFQGIPQHWYLEINKDTDM